MAHLRKKLNNLDTPQFKKIPFNPKWIKNLSSTEVPQDILKLLSLGPKFGLQPTFRDYSVSRILADVENILSHADNSDLLSLRSSSNNILLNFSNRPRQPISELDKIYRETVSFLKTHPNLLVLTSDKGNATVLMDRDQYLNLSQSLLDDDRYYQPLSTNPCSKFTNKINKFITHLKNIKIIDQPLAKFLHNYDGYAPRFYCLPKIHKPTLSMRPIVSSINSPNTNIAKFLTDILSKSYNYNNNFNIVDSFHFSEFINNFELPQGYILVSFDVVSLFTNLPLSSVITSLRNHWNSIQPNCPVSWDVFAELLQLTFDTNFLVFNDKYYLQIFGTPMGSSISPILVNYVLDDLVSDRLGLLDFQIPFIKRYVDDLLLALPPDKIQATLSLFNEFDPHLQFTVELEDSNTNSIPFLDMRVIRMGDNTLTTSWYRKPMASNRFLNYHSCHPFKYKLNLIKALSCRLNRLIHPINRRESFQLLKNILVENSYPSSLINKYLFAQSYGSSLNDIPNGDQLRMISNNSINNTVLPNTVLGNPTTHYSSLPYFPQVTEKLVKLYKHNNVPVKIAIKNAKTVRNLFSKTKTPLSLLEQVNVIYHIPCAECDSCYIGQTGRSLRGRLTTHRSDINLSKHTCALAQHAINTKHEVNFNEVKILGTERNLVKRQFLEMCAILKHPNTLNKRTDISNLSQIYHALILQN
ncbi:uncharacterized protein [Diabrotica undecimpunctata]|uniref:uncharacterized protein isoform X1 n=1 Tax=Diabrotica undecimpunctata TaxID=50387 RepID=UPI003B63BC2E